MASVNGAGCEVECEMLTATRSMRTLIWFTGVGGFCRFGLSEVNGGAESCCMGKQRTAKRTAAENDKFIK